MKIYQIKKVNSNLCSPYIASLDLVEKVIENLHGGKFQIIEISIEENAQEAVKKEAKERLFGERKVIIYAYDKNDLSKRKKQIESNQETYLTRLKSYNQETGSARIFSVEEKKQEGQVENKNFIAIADDYLVARKIAMQYSAEKVVIVERELFFDANKCISRMGTNELFGYPAIAIWEVGSPCEVAYSNSLEQYNKVIETMNDMKKQASSLKKANTRAKGYISELEENNLEWQTYADDLRKQLIDVKTENVVLRKELKEIKKHPIKNLIGREK